MVVGADDKDTMKLNLLRDQVPPSVKDMAMDMTSGRSGYRTVDDRGEPSWAFYRSTSSGLSLAVIYPNSAVSALVRSLTYRLLVVSVLSILAISLAIAVTYRGIDRPLRAVAALAERVGRGDLSVDLESVGYNCKDSLGAMIKALSSMVDGLKGTVRGIYSQSEMIASSAEGLSSLSDQSSDGSERVLRSIMEISALAEENSAALEQTNAGVEEVSSSTTMVADSSVQGAEAADSASRTSQEAVAMVVQVIN
ncbi:methyl-accepting chemotaxis protein [Dethiosulfovibrio salsuginis]|uniref:Methyl-accepting chemotaxis protein n=1 Tax=Dethiosulfovibrio salsuginis TaxID=561720 RepID=A0A1X7L5S3_9BACT|nr:methyl-accepting chemotaxis protein [Dethiosulfovibrio salsuginis]